MKEKFRRARQSRLPKPRIVVVTEGEVTEPVYLRLLNRLYGLHVVVDPIGLGQDPRAVVERAIAEKKQAASDPDAKGDSFWAMFDRDEHARFHEAVDLGRNHGIKLAISNPCFELWAILHYEWIDAPIDRRACQDQLRRLCPSYGNLGKQFVDRQAIQSGYDVAVQRARQLLTRRCEEGKPRATPRRPSSN